MVPAAASEPRDRPGWSITAGTPPPGVERTALTLASVSSAKVPGVRLAELIAALSLGTDLGLGQPMEHVLRQCRIALGLVERLGLEESERVVTYYVALLAWVGCHSDAYEQAKWFGDDIALKAEMYAVDMRGTAQVSFLLRHLGAGREPVERVRTAIRFLAAPDSRPMEMTHCSVAGQLAERLGLGEGVRDCLQQVYERWDGKGQPAGLKGEETAVPARLVQFADTIEVFHRGGGVEAAVEVASARRGTQFDPNLVDVLIDDAEGLLEGLDTTPSWDSVIAVEPALEIVLTGEWVDAALEAIADFADLKSPYTISHSRAVASLAAEAGRRFGLPDRELPGLRRAALVHDLGRLGVSNAVWDKPGELSSAERERVRLHPYLTERMLASSAPLAPLGRLAAQHHERLDGSGYPQGLSADALGPAARLLAAADCYQAMTEPRPHRAALGPDDAERELRTEVRAGRLDGEAVSAVLAAAGHRVRRRREFPAGLTPREVEVLGLVARGLTNRQIAERLVISRKTASNHVEHIYAKIGIRSRAAAGLFAAQHGLLPEPIEAETG